MLKKTTYQSNKQCQYDILNSSVKRSLFKLFGFQFKGKKTQIFI